MVVLAGAAFVAFAASASARTLCAGGNHCARGLRGAIAAARAGDTVRLAPGHYHGGIHIEKSIRLLGAGVSTTTISGGGPVITIGRFLGAHPPRVEVAKLVISGGRTHGNGIEALGGGVYIPPAKGFHPGATVTLRGVAIEGNRAEPTKTGGPNRGQVKEWPRCPGGPCPFAIGAGGGIDSFGSLTIRASEVDRNFAGGQASDAVGGGIASNLGALRIFGTEIAGNHAEATMPKSRFAEGGGVFVSSGSVLIRGSNLEGNRAILHSKLPARAGKVPIEMNANSGGLHAGDGVPVTIADTDITESKVEANDPRGEPLAFDAAMLAGDAPLKMDDVEIGANSLIAVAADSKVAGPSGGALEVDGGGVIEGLLLDSNSSEVSSTSGTAQGVGALGVLNFNEDAKPTVVRDSTIKGNRVVVMSDAGSALARGAGIVNDSLLVLEDVEVSGNRGRAVGVISTSQGGGIWNGSAISGPPVRLTLRHAGVAKNRVTVASGGEASGGGIYSESPLALFGSRLEANAPEDCSGC